MGGCDQRIEVIVEMQVGGGGEGWGGGGVTMDVYKELMFL